MKHLEKLSQRLTYHFKDKNSLKYALSHRSSCADNNERLEFLGDAVLNFIIAEALYRQYPHAKEGRLSRYRAALVREETLASLAKEFSLGDHLVLGLGELKAGGAQRSSILADAMEAVIGAIFIDSDFETCRSLLLKWFSSRIQDVSEKNDEKDPKTQLQEYLQRRKKELAKYEIVSIEGKAHSQLFHVRCEVPSLHIQAEGAGLSRRKAEQMAARVVLEKLQK